MIVSEQHFQDCEWSLSFAAIHPSTLEKHREYNPTLVLQVSGHEQVMSGCKHRGYMWHDCHLLCLQRHHPLKVMETWDILSVTCSSSSFPLKTFNAFWPYSRLLCSPIPELIVNPPLHPVLSILSVWLTADVRCKRNHSKKFTLC